jgi:acetyl esterase/lipase
MSDRITRLYVPLLLLTLLFGGCHALAQPAAENQPAATQQPAAAAPQAPEPSEKDVVYGVAEGEKLLLDIYRCATPGPHPALVMIHGGGWSGGDKAGDRDFAAYLTSKVGIVCFSINYRLAPKYKFPAQVLDCARAVRWVRAHAAEYDADPARVGAFGASAGGHLSLMMGVIEPNEYQSADDPNRALSAKVRAVVDVCGPADMSARGPWSDLALQIATGFIGASQEAAPEKWAEASPITHVTSDDAATLLIHGGKDTLVPPQQSELMHAALQKAGVATELIVVPNGDHSFQGAEKAAVEAALVRAGEWLTEHLKPAEPAQPGAE